VHFVKGLTNSKLTYVPNIKSYNPARNWPADVGWKAEGPETDRWRQSVESVSGSGSVQSVQRVAGFCKRHRNLQKSRQNVQKLSTFAPKIVKISLDLLESRQISPNIVEISPKSAWISLNLTKNQLGSPWISLDFTKYGRDLVEISLDLLEYRQISPNMVEISLDLLESELDLAGGSGQP